MLTVTNTTTLDDAVAQLESGLKNVPGIRAAAGRVTLAQTQVTVSLADIGKAIRPESVSTAADDLKRQCHAFLDSLLSKIKTRFVACLTRFPCQVSKARSRAQFHKPLRYRRKQDLGRLMRSWAVLAILATARAHSIN